MKEQDRHDTHRSDGLIPTLVITTLVFFLLLGGALLLAREMPAIRERAVVSALERGDLAAARKRAARLSDPELAERYRCECAYREAAALMEQGDWAAARRELRILCDMVPDERDPRHAEASAKLIDVENRQKKGGAR